MTLAQAIVLMVALQRGIELAIAASNTRRLIGHGAVEVGREHYPLVVALHAAWLVAILLGAPADAAPNLALLAVFVLLQLARIWVILSLGRRWTTRIIVPPSAELVRTGPYRFCRHPNYAIVVAEIAVLPAAFGLWRIALIFTLLNAALLCWRVRIEDRALGLRR